MSDYGIAIDLGTSTISISLFNITKRTRIGLVQVSNPQVEFGEDVITRIKYQLSRKASQPCLMDLIRTTLIDTIIQTMDNYGISSSQISDVVIVGNTAMHHILFGLPLESLLNEPYRTQNTEKIETLATSIGLPIEDATLYSPPVIDSFVGSDALGVILGFGLSADVYPSIVLDIGTNSEIIVQYLNKFWIGSAASGPAFERMSVSCGMPALAGAIKEFKIEFPERSVSYTTIGAKPPRGICGVGAISALYAMRRLNLMDENGSINRNWASDMIKHDGEKYWIELVDSKSAVGQKSIYLDQMDIRMLQQSKASIRAVLEILLQESNCDPSEIKSIWITGAFGAELDVLAAQGINMFPQFANLQSIRQNVGGALIGAELLLWRKSLRSEILDIINNITYVEMMDNRRYQEMHAKFLYFP